MFLTRGFIALAVFGFFCASAQAQDFPNRPVQLVVPVAAGSATDFIARTVADGLSKRIGQVVVVDNKAGGAGVTGTMAGVTAKPDGYTLVIGWPGTIIVNPIVLEKIPYDPIRDLSPVTQITRFPMVLVVDPNLPVKTLAEFIQYAKARPGELNYGSAGVATTGHLTMELFKQEAGVDLVHVPFRDPAFAMVELLAGRLSAMFDTVTLAAPHIATGKLRALGVSPARPSPLIPQLRPIEESGVKNFDVNGWMAIFVPAGTPPAIVEYLSKQIAEVMNDPETQKRLFDRGMEATSSTPEGLRALIAGETKIWRALAERAQLKPNYQ